MSPNLSPERKLLVLFFFLAEETPPDFLRFCAGSVFSFFGFPPLPTLFQRERCIFLVSCFSLTLIRSSPPPPPCPVRSGFPNLPFSFLSPSFSDVWRTKDALLVQYHPFSRLPPDILDEMGTLFVSPFPLFIFSSCVRELLNLPFPPSCDLFLCEYADQILFLNEFLFGSSFPRNFLTRVIPPPFENLCEIIFVLLLP